MEFSESDEARVRETLRSLAAPQLFAQPRLLLTSQHCASLIPCKVIDMILVRTLAQIPLKFPLNLPLGLFDIVEGREATWAETEHQDGQDRGQEHRRSLQVEIHTLGGWRVTLKAVAMIRGNLQDERQLFSHLPDLPTIPFRLEEGGFGLINTTNVMRATARPKPEALAGIPLPLTLRRWTPARTNNPANVVDFEPRN
jgi:hypothetical protein